MGIFPKGFSQRIVQQSSVPEPEKLLSALNSPGRVSVRVNRGKAQATLPSENKIPWSENGYYLASRPSFTFDPFFQSGCYYVQESSSMFLEEVLRQCCSGIKGPTILDLCGAPGGKSVILSDFAGTEGLVLANEVIRSRSHILAENITKWGTTNTVVTSSDPSAFKRLPGFFDIMVVDAPCSGEGMFREQEVREHWSEGNLAICCERQRRILADAWPALKGNGILIYSTCTFNPRENEENLSWLAGLKNVEPVAIDITSYPSVTEIVYEGINGYYFFPHIAEGEGFFIAVLRKRDSEKRYKRDRLPDVFSQLSNKERQIFNSWTNGDSSRIIRVKEDYILLHTDADRMAIIYNNLGVVKFGTRLATIKGNKVIPFHDLALSMALNRGVFPEAGLGFDDSIAFLRRDNLILKERSKGYMLVTYKGMPMGFVNNLGNRVNTLYPVEHRIRSMKPDGLSVDPGLVVPGPSL